MMPNPTAPTSCPEHDRPVKTMTERVHARLGRIGGKLTTTVVFRRNDDELRRYLAEQFRGLRVIVADRHGRTYRGLALSIAATTDGNVPSVLVVDSGPGQWPIALSLATIDSITEA